MSLSRCRWPSCARLLNDVLNNHGLSYLKEVRSSAHASFVSTVTPNADGWSTQCTGDIFDAVEPTKKLTKKQRRKALSKASKQRLSSEPLVNKRASPPVDTRKRKSAEEEYRQKLTKYNVVPNTFHPHGVGQNVPFVPQTLKPPPSKSQEYLRHSQFNLPVASRPSDTNIQITERSGCRSEATIRQDDIRDPFAMINNNNNNSSGSVAKPVVNGYAPHWSSMPKAHSGTFLKSPPPKYKW